MRNDDTNKPNHAEPQEAKSALDPIYDSHSVPQPWHPPSTLDAEIYAKADAHTRLRILTARSQTLRAAIEALQAEKADVHASMEDVIRGA